MQSNNATENKIYNTPCEQVIIGAILGNSMRLNKIDYLLPEHFYEPVHQRIWEKINQLIRDGKDVNATLIASAFESDDAIKELGGTGYLYTLECRGDSVLNFRDYAEIVFDLAVVREYRAVITKAYDDVEKQGASLDIPDAMKTLSENILEYSLKSRQFELKIAKKVGQSILESMDEKREMFYSTGIRCIDKSLGGGVSPETSIAIGGATGQGKTMLLGSISFNMAKAGIPVLYIAAEMGSSQIHQRMMARMMGENAIGFKVKRTESDFISKAITAQSGDDLSLYYCDATRITLDKLKTVIVSASRQYDIKVVFIDYLQLIQGRESKQSQVEHQELVAQWLADVAKQEYIATVYAAQVNKEDNFRGGGIEFAPDYSYVIKKIGDPSDAKTEAAYLTQIKSRHAMVKDIGNEHDPSLHFAKTGSHLYDYEIPYDQKDEYIDE